MQTTSEHEIRPNDARLDMAQSRGSVYRGVADAADRSRSGRAADDDRRDKGNKAIDQICIEKRTVHRRAALDQHRIDAEFGKQPEHRVQIDPPVALRQLGHLRAGFA